MNRIRRLHISRTLRVSPALRSLMWACACAFAGGTPAQSFPHKPLRFVTSEVGGGADLGAKIGRLRDAGIRVSLFIEADERQLEAAVVLGAPVVELHTGRYCELEGAAQKAELERQAGRLAGDADSPAVTRARHREGLMVCIESIDRALIEGEAELRAEQLRLASQALGRITGRIDVEDVLDALFRTFCIGK